MMSAGGPCVAVGEEEGDEDGELDGEVVGGLVEIGLSRGVIVPPSSAPAVQSPVVAVI